MDSTRRGVSWGLLLRVGSFAAVCFAGNVSTAEAASPVGRLLVFLPEGVDWIALPVEGYDLPAVRADFARRVFESRDLDHDGILVGDEAKRLVVWSADQQRLRLLGDAWKSADTTPADEKLSLAECQAYASHAFGPEVRIVVDNRGSRRAGVLFTLIDQDRNGRLTAEELRHGSARLLRCDFDDDEMITLSELAELRLAADANAPAAFDSEPFLLLQSADSIPIAVREIEARFRLPGTAGVSLQRIAGIEAASDKNADGVLDSSELEQLLQSPPTTGQLRIKWGGNRGEVLWETASREVDTTATRRSGSVSLKGLRFSARFFNTAIYDQLQRQELMSQFAGADRDNNEYLSALEFAEFVSVLDAELAPDPAMADVNGNAQITREEVTLFNELRERAGHCQIQLTVQREMKSLFDALDQDRNKGVSGWEMLSSSEQLKTLDQNHDGSLAITELSGELSLLVSFGTTRRERPAAPLLRSRTQKVPPRKAGTQGPVWFQRMDRNQDQRVSWREFLGTREQFQSLDQNHDGSIAVVESLQ